MKKLIFFLLTVSFIITGCGERVGESTPTPTPTQPPTETVLPTPTHEIIIEDTPTVEPVFTYEKSICPFNITNNVNLECGFVTVPEDHNQPDGDVIRLAVVIIKDESENHQPDPVILLTGGPGEKAVANTLNFAYLFDDIHPNRDFIIFDQRGVGLSEPALECPNWAEVQYDILDEEDVYVASETVFNALMDCRDQLVSEGHNLSVYNTTQNAADVNAIRLALGYDQVNLFGGSYGSNLAQAVARDHPEMIRSMVINSTYPLEVSFSVESPIVTYDAVIRLLEACESDPDCDQTYPDIQDVFFEVVERLNNDPVLVTVTHMTNGKNYPVLLTGDMVFRNLVGFLYITDFIPMLPKAIYDVYNGDYELIAQLQGVYLSLYEATSRGMTYSVLCAEDVVGVDVEDFLDNLESLPGPTSDSDDPELIRNYGFFALCEEWPVEEVDPAYKQPLVSDIPTLVLQGEFDPVTPLKFAQMVVENLSHSYLYEFPGVGHDVTAGTDCSRQMMGDFIENPNQAPETSCLAQLSTGFNIPYEDPTNAYNLPIPPDWTVEEKEDYVKLTSPDEKITASVFVQEGEDIQQGLNASWEMIDADFYSPPNIIERSCVGCATDNADKFMLITYGTGSEDEVILGAAWIHDGMTYLILFQSDRASFDARESQAEAIIIGFTVNEIE
jgi:pimeloyl-ACP methyl ester carboxylesterase